MRSNLNGGRSRNIASHLTRSDGFDASSQWLAFAGLRYSSAFKPRERGLLRQQPGDGGPHGGQRVVAQRDARGQREVAMICQSSRASPGGTMALAVHCRWPDALV